MHSDCALARAAGDFSSPERSHSPRLIETQRGIMEVVEVEGEAISPEDYENDAGWITSHQQRSSRAQARLTDRVSRSQDGARREPAHKIQNHLGVRRPRLPPLPREDIKIVIRPRDGLNTSRVSYAQLRDGVLRAAAVSTERASDDVFRLHPGQNIMVVSTPTMENAKKYCSIKELKIGNQTYATTAYVTPPENTSKGVIHNIPNYDTQEDVTKSLVNSKNPAILQARRMGKTSSVIIVFEGTKVPHYVYYRGAEYRCFLHKKKVEVCNTCGHLGHRTDVCPSPNEKHCKGCRIKDPPENHQCDPTCAICGKAHITGDKKCRNRFKTPFLLKQRQWERQQRSKQEEDRTGYGILRGENHQSRDTSTQDATKDAGYERRQRSGSFPRLPPPDDGEKHNSKRHRSRSKSKIRRDSRRAQSRSTSSSSPQSRRGRSQSSDRNKRDNGNKVSWADTVSHNAPIRDNKKLGPSPLEQELVRFRQMLEQVTKENRLLKEEIVKLKADKQYAQTAATPTEKGAPVAVTMQSNGDSSPPFKRKASEKPQTYNDSEEFKQLNNSIDRRFEAMDGKIEAAISKLTDAITDHFAKLETRLTALEVTHRNTRTAGVGPIKSSKPYSRPASADMPKFNMEDTNAQTGPE